MISSDPWSIRQSHSWAWVWALCGVLVFAHQTHATVFVTGPDLNSSRSTGGGGLFGTGDWDNGNLTLSWDIEQRNTIPGSEEWSYAYTFSSNGSTELSKELSHWILEVSASIVPDNLHSILYDWNPSAQGDAVSLSGPDGWLPSDGGNSNPGLPGAIYGIKFDFESENFDDGESVTYSFLSTRAPIWGNVYGKSGTDKNDTIDVYFYNEGFTDSATPIPQTSTGPDTWLSWIATPDTVSSLPPSETDDDPAPIVPEPSSLALAGLGALGLATFAYRRRQRSKSPNTSSGVGT